MIRNARTNKQVRSAGYAVAVLFVAAASYSLGAEADREEKRADTNEVVAVDLADRTIADCSNPTVAPDPATCQKAAEVKTVIEQRTVEVPAPRRSDAEVRKLIEDTLRENPDLLPRGPAGETPAVDYDRIVREVQAKIPAPAPGKDGETPTIDYDRIIRDVVLQIPVPEDGQSPPCLSTPQQCQGKDGVNGKDGVDGEPGRGIVTGPYPVSTEEGCVMRTIYDQAPTQVDTPTSALNCLP